MRFTLAALIGLFAVPAFAQSQFFEVDESVSIPELEMTVDQADDLDVYNSANEKIGEVEEVVGSNRAMASSFVVDFDDDFPQYGDEDRVIEIANFEFDGRVLILSDEIDVTTLPTRMD